MNALERVGNSVENSRTVFSTGEDPDGESEAQLERSVKNREA
jgi:hypothetical protein